MELALKVGPQRGMWEGEAGPGAGEGPYRAVWVPGLAGEGVFPEGSAPGRHRQAEGRWRGGVQAAACPDLGLCAVSSNGALGWRGRWEQTGGCWEPQCGLDAGCPLPSV